MKKAIIIDSALAQYTAEELSWLQKFFLQAGILGDSAGTLGLAVTERGAGANMSVDVSVGNALIDFTKNATTWKIIGLNNAIENVAVPTQSSGANRVGAVIMRASIVNEPNVLKNNIITIEFIPGTSTGALSDGAISTAISNDMFIRLADVTVPSGASSIVNANITDTRVQCKTNEAIKLAPKTLNFSILASDPATPVEGQVWYNSTTHTLNFYNNTTVKQLGSTSGLFNPFVVSAQSTPGMTLAVASGEAMIGATPVHYAGGNSPTFVVPATGGHKRIDLLVINNAGTLSIVQGVSHATTPVAPSYPLGYLVLAEVYLRNGGTSIKNLDDSTNCYLYRDPRGLYVPNESTGRIGEFVAGEAIGLGDAFFLASGQPLTRATWYQPTNTQNYNTGYNIGYNNTEKAAQVFVAKTSTIKRIVTQFNNSGSSGTINGTVTIEIFATSGGAPTGSAIWSETIPTFSLSGYQQLPFTYDIVSGPTLTPGVVYCIAFKNNSGSSLGVGYSNLAPMTGYDAYTYTASTWSVQTGGDLTLELYDSVSAPTVGQAYISEGYTEGEHNVVTGFAQEAVSAGGTFKGIVNGIVGGMSFGASVSTVAEATDQECTGGSEITQQLYSGSNPIRQIFKTGNISNLTKLEIDVVKVNGGGGAVTINVYDLFTGKLVGSGTMADGFITTSRAYFACTFSTPLNVKPNYSYYWEAIAGAGNSGTNYYNLYARQSSSPYDYGMAYWAGAWNTTIDFHFRTKYTKAVAWSVDDPLYLGFGTLAFNSNSIGLKVGNVITASQFLFDTNTKEQYIFSLSSGQFGNQMNSSEQFKIAIPKKVKKVKITVAGTSSNQAECEINRFGKTTGPMYFYTGTINGTFQFNNSNDSVQYSHSGGTASYVMHFYK